MKRDSVFETFKIAFLLCLVCSVLVSVAAVGLRGLQQQNQEVDKQKNILIAAGLFDETAGRIVIDDKPRTDLKVSDLFQKPAGAADRPWLEERIVDLETGEEISTDVQKKIVEKFGSVERYSQRKAARDVTGSWSRPIAADKDVAAVKRRERYATVYLVRQPDGKLDQVILPIRGYGLWSTLWGFISLKADLVTISGITYYEHAETPGLGGEVDNRDWKKSWKGKKAFADGNVAIRVLKGSVDPKSKYAEHEVDGLSGATITSKGVSNMLEYWLGPEGFGPYLKRLKAEMKHVKK